MVLCIVICRSRSQAPYMEMMISDRRQAGEHSGCAQRSSSSSDEAPRSRIKANAPAPFPYPHPKGAERQLPRSLGFRRRRLYAAAGVVAVDNAASSLTGCAGPYRRAQLSRSGIWHRRQYARRMHPDSSSGCRLSAPHRAAGQQPPAASADYCHRRSPLRSAAARITLLTAELLAAQGPFRGVSSAVRYILGAASGQSLSSAFKTGQRFSRLRRRTSSPACFSLLRRYRRCEQPSFNQRHQRPRRIQGGVAQ